MIIVGNVFKCVTAPFSYYIIRRTICKELWSINKKRKCIPSVYNVAKVCTMRFSMQPLI